MRTLCTLTLIALATACEPRDPELLTAEDAGLAGDRGGGGGGREADATSGGAQPPVDCDLIIDDRCPPRPVACESRESADDCEAAACHFYDEACHTAPEPLECDQPDPSTCEAAGCEWSPDFGCRAPNVTPACEDLREPACNARMDCHFIDNRCELDPAAMPCEALDLMQCAVRNDCAFSQETGVCGPRAEGPCGNLDESACSFRPDCLAVFLEQEGCDCAGPAEDRAPCSPDDPACGDPAPCGCPAVFSGCAERVVDCAGVPEAACDATPGCHLEGCGPNEDCITKCLNDAPADCGALTIDQCVSRPDCHLEAVPRCGGAEAPVPPDGGGDFLPPDGDCAEAVICVANFRSPCGERQGVNACVDDGQCEWQAVDNCACPEPDPVPCVCDDGQADCLCIEPAPACDCGVCVDPRGPQGCNALDLMGCQADPKCEWIDVGVAGGGAPQGDPIDCVCPDGDPNCACARPAPPPEGFCQERFVEPCLGLPADVCVQVPGCGLDEPMCPDCRPGQDCPPCLPIGACVSVAMICDRLPVETCATDDRCAVQVAEICEGFVPADCAEGDACEPPPPPPVCEVVEWCAAAPSPCLGLDEAACNADAACVFGFIEDGRVACECATNAAGEEICLCVDPQPVGVCGPR